MRHFLAFFSIRLLIALSLLVGAARMIGGLGEYPAQEMLRLFECSPQPCWHGMHIGVTTVDEAVKLLSADETIRLSDYDPSDNFVCWRWNNQWRNKRFGADGCYSLAPDSYYTLNLFYMDNPLRLSDVFLLIGKPVSSYLCLNYHDGLIYSDSMTLRVFVPDNQRINPELAVVQIGYYAPNSTTRHMLNFGWRGFSKWAVVDPNCAG
jgi:hypothetical protein